MDTYLSLISERFSSPFVPLDFGDFPSPLTQKATICVGISASGKTTWANQEAALTGATIVCRDTERFLLTNTKGWSSVINSDGYKFNKKIEKEVTAICADKILSAYSRSKDVIIADTNLNKERRLQLIEHLEDIGYSVVIKEFPITLEEAWARDSLRAYGVGHCVIYKQWQQWNEYTNRRAYTPDESLLKAVIYDLDGTLAHMTSRGAYDWNRVGEDIADEFVGDMCHNHYKEGYTVIVLSGRSDVCKPETSLWLQDNCILYHKLLMRKEGDERKDSVVKEEILFDQISPHYNVHAVVDDRPVVLRMWNDIKIPKVISVGNPWVEF